MKNSKSFKRGILLLAIFGFSIICINAQNSLKRVAIIHIDSRGWAEKMTITQLTRIEMGKLNHYDVLDRYDVEDMLKKNNKKAEDCLGKDCLLESGRLLKADYVLSGSVEKFSNKVLVMFREIDMLTGKTSRTVIKDYPGFAYSDL